MARGEFLVTALEAAEYLGITFSRFKVAIWRGMGLDPKRKPNGTEAKPVVGGWSARSAKYRASDIKRMHELYPFRANRTPDNGFFRLVPMPAARTRQIPKPTLRATQAVTIAVPTLQLPARAPAASRTRARKHGPTRGEVPKPGSLLFDWLR